MEIWCRLPRCACVEMTVSCAGAPERACFARDMKEFVLLLDLSSRLLSRPWGGCIFTQDMGPEKIMRVYRGDCSAVDGRFYDKPDGNCTSDFSVTNSYTEGFAMPAINVEKEKNINSDFASCQRHTNQLNKDTTSYIGRCRGHGTMKFRYKKFDDDETIKKLGLSKDAGDARAIDSAKFSDYQATKANVMFLKKAEREDEASFFFWKKDLFDWKTRGEMREVTGKKASFEMSCDAYTSKGKKQHTADDYSVEPWPSSELFFSGNDCDLIRVQWKKAEDVSIWTPFSLLDNVSNIEIPHSSGGEVQVESWTCPGLMKCGIPDDK